MERMEQLVTNQEEEAPMRWTNYIAHHIQVDSSRLAVVFCPHLVPYYGTRQGGEKIQRCRSYKL